MEFIFEHVGKSDHPARHRCALKDSELDALSRLGVEIGDDILASALDRALTNASAKRGAPACLECVPECNSN